MNRSIPLCLGALLCPTFANRLTAKYSRRQQVTLITDEKYTCVHQMTLAYTKSREYFFSALSFAGAGFGWRLRYAGRVISLPTHFVRRRTQKILDFRTGTPRDSSGTSPGTAQMRQPCGWYTWYTVFQVCFFYICTLSPAVFREYAADSMSKTPKIQIFLLGVNRYLS